MLDDLISIREACAISKWSLTKMWGFVANGTIKARKVGSTWITTRAEAEKLALKPHGKRGRKRKEVVT